MSANETPKCLLTVILKPYKIKSIYLRMIFKIKLDFPHMMI